ncbi:MAG: preprotein translocase subunit SecY [Oscillospiraceae bacterium]|nr:preprotein translocase subunit SecY [Oscillospiraceae bacterium]
MLQTIRNAWKIADLRKKLLFTFAILLLYRIGNVIPVPFVNTETMYNWFRSSELQNSVLGLFNMMSGSAFSRATVFALAIQPYINASIIIQLLTIAIPALERLSKEGGEEGKKKIERITRYTTVGLGLLMGWAYWMMLKSSNAQSIASGTGEILVQTGFIPALTVILSFTAGSTLVMWLGEQITEFGIGNGISMILFANIVSRLPQMIINLFVGSDGKGGLIYDFKGYWYVALVAIVGIVALVMLIVFVTNAERRLPVSYAKRVVGRKVYGGQNTFLPIKVNMSGVLPIIFAQSVATLPATIAAFAGNTDTWRYKNLWSNTSVPYLVIYLILIIAFSYFYSTIQYNPVEIANNLRKNGGFIPGYRPGRPTSDFIKRVINKITLFGALFLGVVAILPILTGMISNKFAAMAIGGTSVIIVVGVALETVQAIEAQMLMRHYKGFLE